MKDIDYQNDIQKFKKHTLNYVQEAFHELGKFTAGCVILYKSGETGKNTVGFTNVNDQLAVNKQAAASFIKSSIARLKEEGSDPICFAFCCEGSIKQVNIKGTDFEGKDVQEIYDTPEFQKFLSEAKRKDVLFVNFETEYESDAYLADIFVDTDKLRKAKEFAQQMSHQTGGTFSNLFRKYNANKN